MTSPAPVRYRSPEEDSARSERVLKDSASFFRRGRPGAGREALTDSDVGRYLARAASLAPPDLLSWLHREG